MVPAAGDRHPSFSGPTPHSSEAFFRPGREEATVMSCGCSFVTSLSLPWSTHPLEEGDDPLLREALTLANGAHLRLR